MEAASVRILKIIRILEKDYPRSRTALAFETPLQILVATILSAQCTDERVNKLTPALFKKYPTAELSPGPTGRSSSWTSGRRDSSGTRRKASSAPPGKSSRDFGGRVPETMAELVTLPGVARKTANIVLSSAFGKPRGSPSTSTSSGFRAGWAEPAGGPGENRAGPAGIVPGRIGSISIICWSTTAGRSARRASRSARSAGFASSALPRARSEDEENEIPRRQGRVSYPAFRR